LAPETDAIDTIKQKGLTLEWKLFPQCVQLFAENRLACVKMTYTDDMGNISQRTVVKISQPGS